MGDQQDHPNTSNTDLVTNSLLHKPDDDDDGDDDDNAPAGSSPASDPQDSSCPLAGTKPKLGKLARLRKRWRDPGYRRNVWSTLWLGCSFWGLGFVNSQRGPAFLDLQIITGTDVEGASYFFTSHSAGYVVGSLASGVIFDLLNKSLLLLLSLVGLGLTTAALPWCSLYWLMIAINFVTALFASALDTGGTAEILRMWGKEGEMAIQFLHWTYAFGAVLGPLATEPFLTPTPTPTPQDRDTGNSSSPTTTMTNNANTIDSATTNSKKNSTMSARTPSLASHGLWQGTSASPVNNNNNNNNNNNSNTWNMTSGSPSDAAMLNGLRSVTIDVTDSSVWNLSHTDVTSVTGVMPITASPPPTASAPPSTDVHYAFVISGGLILLITIPFILQLYSDHSRKRRQQEEEEEQEQQQRLDDGEEEANKENKKEERGQKEMKNKEKEEKKKKKMEEKRIEQKQPLPRRLFLFVLSVLCLLYLLHCCGEDTAVSYLTAFVVKQLGWSTHQGARLTALFWTTFACCRFSCIFLVHVIGSAKLLALSCLSLILSQVGIVFFASQGGVGSGGGGGGGGMDAGVWVSVMCMGASVAAIFPTGFSWMEKELVRVTGRVTSSIFVSGSVGMMAVPPLVGYLMQEVSPMWYVYLLLFFSSSTIAVFLFLVVLSRVYLRKRRRTFSAVLEIAGPGEEQRPSLEEESAPL